MEEHTKHRAENFAMTLLKAAKDEAWEEGGVKIGDFHRCGPTLAMDKYIDTRITPFLAIFRGDEQPGDHEVDRDVEEQDMKVLDCTMEELLKWMEEGRFSVVGEWAVRKGLSTLKTLNLN